jgi:D-beta-D-heptose 7-phosphate kinase / D-beta-D-heptose 1-phosphate adenosyltransferase
MTTVFTNGCFDLLHAGHLESLKFARAQGDRLIVGLNSDRSVRALKGPGRPIVGQEDRKRLLEALWCVFEVRIFDEDTPIELVKEIRPDVLVKGADWQGKVVVGAEYAGRVAFAPLVQGLSTSDIVRRIKEG